MDSGTKMRQRGGRETKERSSGGMGRGGILRREVGEGGVVGLGRKKGVVRVAQIILFHGEMRGGS